jgi:hypothetical protein
MKKIAIGAIIVGILTLLVNVSASLAHPSLTSLSSTLLGILITLSGIGLLKNHPQAKYGLIISSLLIILSIITMFVKTFLLMHFNTVIIIMALAYTLFIYALIKLILFLLKK